MAAPTSCHPAVKHKTARTREEEKKMNKTQTTATRARVRSISARGGWGVAARRDAPLTINIR